MLTPVIAVVGVVELVLRGADLAWAAKWTYNWVPHLADLLGRKNAELVNLAFGIAGVMLLGAYRRYAKKIGPGGSRTILGAGCLALILATLMAYDLRHRTPAPSPRRIIASVQLHSNRSKRRSPTPEHRKKVGGTTAHRDTGAPAEGAPSSPAGSVRHEQKSPPATSGTQRPPTVHSSPPPVEPPESGAKAGTISHPGTATTVPANTSPPPAASGSSGTGTTATTSPGGPGTITNPGSATGDGNAGTGSG